MASYPLIGTWKLLSWENRSVEEDGRISYPLGEDATGYIMYNQDGNMFVAIMSPYRLKFAGGDLLSGTTEEEAQAEETFLSFCGRYELREDRVIHQIELSSFPNWVSVDQERLMELGENRLTLSTHPMLMQGKKQTAHLIWERVSEPSEHTRLIVHSSAWKINSPKLDSRFTQYRLHAARTNPLASSWKYAPWTLRVHLPVWC